MAVGGQHGLGNVRFKSSTNRAPRKTTPGTAGQTRDLRLELKLIADAGLLGMPNAGKSTLVGAVSAARPKVADYPFTTLSPNLGVVQLSGFRSFVIADIPGIIEGAHEGRGLGHQFLRHIERTRILLLMIPVDSVDPQAELDRLRSELEAYSADLASTPYLVALTKVDVLSEDAELPKIETGNAMGIVSLSSVTRTHLELVLERLWSEAPESNCYWEVVRCCT